MWELGKRNVYQLIYQSTRGAELDTDALRDLTRTSYERNAAKDITGILLVQGDTILQILEGEEDAVNALMIRIQADTRHTNCDVLLTRHCDERSFEGWRMGLCEVSEDDARLFRLTLATVRARAQQRRKNALKLSA